MTLPYSELKTSIQSLAQDREKEPVRSLIDLVPPPPHHVVQQRRVEENPWSGAHSRVLPSALLAGQGSVNTDPNAHFCLDAVMDHLEALIAMVFGGQETGAAAAAWESGAVAAAMDSLVAVEGAPQ